MHCRFTSLIQTLRCSGVREIWRGSSLRQRSVTETNFSNGFRADQTHEKAEAAAHTHRYTQVHIRKQTDKSHQKRNEEAATPGKSQNWPERGGGGVTRDVSPPRRSRGRAPSPSAGFNGGASTPSACCFGKARQKHIGKRCLMNAK